MLVFNGEQCEGSKFTDINVGFQPYFLHAEISADSLKLSMLLCIVDVKFLKRFLSF